MFNAKHLKMSKFIKYIWQLIISTSNTTLELPSLRPCFTPGFSHIFVNFFRKNLPQSFMVFLAVFQEELMNLESFERLTCVDISDIIPANKHT